MHNPISSAYISVRSEFTSVADAIIAFLVCDSWPRNVLADKPNPNRKHELYFYKCLHASVKMSFVTIVYIENFSKYIQCRRKVGGGGGRKKKRDPIKAAYFLTHSSRYLDSLDSHTIAKITKTVPEQVE